MCSTIAGNMSSALSAIQNHLIQTDTRLAMKNLTQPQGLEGYYMTWLNHLPAGIDPSYDSCTLACVPEWPLMTKSTNDLPIDNVPGAPPPEDTPDEGMIELPKPDLTCTPDPTTTTAHRNVVGVENAVGKAYGKATGLYNKHCKYSEQWNPWHPFQSAHDFE